MSTKLHKQITAIEFRGNAHKAKWELVARGQPTPMRNPNWLYGNVLEVWDEGLTVVRLRVRRGCLRQNYTRLSVYLATNHFPRQEKHPNSTTGNGRIQKPQDVTSPC